MKGIKKITVRNDGHSCEVLIAETVLQRLRGLLFRPNWKGGMLLPTKSVHTFFMKQNIDVFYLDRQGRVVHAVLDMKPWRATKVVRKAQMVLEVPSGKLGDMMTGHYIELDQTTKGGMLCV
ncbi:DUF192 domain-containing protein [Lentibacillus salinarum]|uniref:DUF192 domain-containing protein n=1 Tax=Lentibacillus salinarum TaxID=446820 RepID=A0ABW3ZWW3_9BACI